MMEYQVIGLMSGSSMDGLDWAFCRFNEIGGQWDYEIIASDCVPFPEHWKKILFNLHDLTARELLLAHTEFGHWMAQQVLQVMEIHQLEHKVHLIASHGHTVFHTPTQKLSWQMGDGAAIAALTRLPVVSDLRSMDIALGGQGAPLVPKGEELLWPEIKCFLNIGGIANLSIHTESQIIGFDVCPANRVLNAVAQTKNLPYDPEGTLACKGILDKDLFDFLNQLEYYQRTYPKSLNNEFGSETVWKLLQQSGLDAESQLNTYCHHIAYQIGKALDQFLNPLLDQVMVTGGGAFNDYLISCIQSVLTPRGIKLMIPEKKLIDGKEALIMALLGVLRWREENTSIQSVTGASRSSVGGALWMGQEQ